MSDWNDEELSPPEEEKPPLRRQRAERRRPDINELPVWTWVAILLVVVVIGGALWLMTRTSDKGATAPAIPGSRASATMGPATPTPVIGANTPTPLPPDHITVGIRVRVSGTGATQLRLRAGPGTNYATLLIVPDGTTLKVLEGPESQDGYQWWRLQMDDGTIGWAVEQFLVPVGW